jgi:hypothetical protein
MKEDEDEVKIIDYFKSISDDAKLIFYLFIFLCVLFIIFFPLILTWTNDPFKKIILAPLVEEPLKLIYALTFWFAVFQSVTALKIKQWKISDSFLDHFAIYGVITGIAFGVGEGPLGNIFLHAASSLIGAIFILFIFLKVKNKPWTIGYKLTSIVLSLSIPMFIHSLSNQFSSIYFVNVNPEFNYLVIIGRYLRDNTIITDSFRFNALMIVVAGIIIIIWYLYLFFQKEKGDVSKKIFSVRTIFAIGTIFGLILILLRVIDFQSGITSLMIVSAALLITMWYLYLFFQRQKGDASKKIFGLRIIFGIGIIFGIIYNLYGLYSFLPTIDYYLRHPALISSLVKTIVTGFIGPMLFILLPIAGLLLTKKPSEKSVKPKTKWGFRTLFAIGIIFAVYQLSTIIQIFIQFSFKGLGGDIVQIIYISVLVFVFPIYFILIAVAGLLLTK